MEMFVTAWPVVRRDDRACAGLTRLIRPIRAHHQSSRSLAALPRGRALIQRAATFVFYQDRFRSRVGPAAIRTGSQFPARAQEIEMRYGQCYDQGNVRVRFQKSVSAA
jgi:hypothetical protein